jgi:pyruvate formate lyase activating enzyme
VAGHWEVTLSTIGTIFDVKRFSIHDGPGIRTTIFFKGCPLNCAWCHNPEGIAATREMMYWEKRCARCGTCMDICPQNAISPSPEGTFIIDPNLCTLCGDCAQACPYEARRIVGREVTVAQVMADIERDVVFYDESGGGVTFSGGEPLMQPGFLLALLQACREREIHTAVDTTGFAAPGILDRIGDNADMFLFDLKLMDDERHQVHTGVSNALILSNLRRLSSKGHNVIVRTPILPGINDDDENIVRTGEFVSSLAGPPQIDILPYHNTGVDKYHKLGKTYRLPDLKSLSNSRMTEIANTLRGFGLQVTIGGQ